MGSDTLLLIGTLTAHLWHVKPVLSQLHGVGGIMQCILRVHLLVLRAEARGHGINEGSHKCTIVPIGREVVDCFVGEFFLQQMCTCVAIQKKVTAKMCIIIAMLLVAVSYTVSKGSKKCRFPPLH